MRIRIGVYLALVIGGLVLPTRAIGQTNGVPAPGAPVAPGYFRIDQVAQAQDLARQKHWVLAWIDAWPEALSHDDYEPGSDTALAQEALKHLRGRVAVIFVTGAVDLPRLSPIIRDQQLFQIDDGPLPDGHHFITPKIVFSDADVTRGLGRVSHTQMASAGVAAAIDAELASIAAASNGQIKIGDPADQIFPGGKKAVKLSSFVYPPTAGIQFDQTTEAMKANGVSKDQVVVACDGIEVDNMEQYQFVRDSTDSPDMTLVVWDGQEYHETNVNVPHRRFGVQMHDYKP